MSASPDQPDIPLNEPIIAELREIIAALAVLARLDLVFLDAAAGPRLVQALTRIGHPDEDHHLPAIREWPAAPEVTDPDSGRLYVRALHDRLRDLKPGFDPRPE